MNDYYLLFMIAHTYVIDVTNEMNKQTSKLIIYRKDFPATRKLNALNF